MLLNDFVFALVPSSTSAKFVNGVGEPVNENDVDPFGVASLMTVIEPGSTTASAESPRSWFPMPQSNGGFLPLQDESSGVVSVVSRMWNGAPLIVAAEFPCPQFARDAMWPPHARTAVVAVAVNVTVVPGLLLAPYTAPAPGAPVIPD